jgi:hypothetical protein
VAMTAIQFLLFEPDNLVKGNDEVKNIGGKLVDLIIDQLKFLQETEPQG